MAQLGAFLALACAAAVLLTGLRRVANAYNETGRKILRGLRKVLEGEVHAFLIDYGRGCGVGFNFTSMMMAVAWSAGEWCRIYRIDEMTGVELMVDDRRAGWAFADHSMRLVDGQTRAEGQVSLRHMFDDPHHPHFMLELWNVDQEEDETIPDAQTAVEQGNRWLEGMAALMAAARRGPLEIDETA
jgi:hypothetical protein